MTYLMSQKGFGMVAYSRVIGASGRARGSTQPFYTLTETYVERLRFHTPAPDAGFEQPVDLQNTSLF